ncbi:MAG: hypothetical protein E7663_03215 [Ruminococcaceae bacterium]|nr:hypothetical protein [Oscillospiraceae bacterium]
MMNKHTKIMIKSICHGYGDRAAEIGRGERGNPRRAELLAEYRRLNEAVDKGLLVCPDRVIRGQIKKSLIDNLPFEHTVAYCGRNQFYAMRRGVMNEISRNLNLSE